MTHVHWWLFGLAFAVGLVLTFVLLVRPLKRRAAAAARPSRPEWPTTNATATGEFFTTGTSAEDQLPPVDVSAEAGSATADAAAHDEPVTAKVPVEADPAPEEAAAAAGAEATDVPADREYSTRGIEDPFAVANAAAREASQTRVPAESGPPATKIAIEEQSPAVADGGEEEAPARDVTAADQWATTHSLLGRESPPQRAAAEAEFATTPSGAHDVAHRPEIPADHGSPTTETRGHEESPTTTMPAAQEEPPAKRSWWARWLRRNAPRPREAPTARMPVATQSPTKRTPAAPAGPAKKAAPSKGAPVKKAPPAGRGPVKKPPPAKLWPEKKAPVAGGAPVKKAPPAKASPARRPRKLPYEPFGPGSARATLDGGGPAGWLVKGRTDTRLYYTPDDPAYELTVAQVWFKDEQSAARALFTPWCKSSRKR